LFLSEGAEGKRRTTAAVSTAEKRDRAGDDADVRGGGLLHVQHPAAGQQRAGGVLRHSAERADRHQQPAGGHQLLGQLHHLRHLRRQVQAALPQDFLAAEGPLLPPRRPRLARGHPRGEFRVQRPHVQRPAAEWPPAQRRPRRQAAADGRLWPLALCLLPRRGAQEPRRTVLILFSHQQSPLDSKRWFLVLQKFKSKAGFLPSQKSDFCNQGIILFLQF